MIYLLRYLDLGGLTFQKFQQKFVRNLDDHPETDHWLLDEIALLVPKVFQNFQAHLQHLYQRRSGMCWIL